MSRRLALALLVAGVATLAPAAAAAATKPTPPSITLRPSRAEGVLSGRVRVGPFSLINGTQASYQVRLFPILLGQARDASLFVHEDARSLRQARSLMRPELGRFRFPPGANTSTALRVRRVPRQHSLYSGLVFEAVPRQTGAGSPQLKKVFRLTATILLDPPRPQRHIRFVPEAMRAEQAGPRKLRIAIGVKNRGNYYTPASGIFRIRDAGGRVVARQGLPGVRILPGAVVDLDSIVTKILPAGAYTLEGSLRAGGGRIPIAGSMRLLGPSTVAFRDATLSTPPTPKAYLGEPFDLKARFQNTGNVTFAPRAVVDVRRVTGRPGRPLRINAAADKVKPGQHGSVSAKVRLPGPGTYELTVRLLYGGRQLDFASVGVTPVKKPPLPTRIVNSIKNDPITWLLVLAAIALLLVGSLLVYVASLRRRQAQPAPPVPAPPAAPLPAVATVEPVPPPPPPAPVPVPSSNGPVNLNSASVEELMTLPGVGRQAAGRILAHREANGPYTDASELSAIEGFHAERISRLRASVRV